MISEPVITVMRNGLLYRKNSPAWVNWSGQARKGQDNQETKGNDRKKQEMTGNDRTQQDTTGHNRKRQEMTGNNRK